VMWKKGRYERGIPRMMMNEISNGLWLSIEGCVFSVAADEMDRF
jgi:hypothetical protein